MHGIWEHEEERVIGCESARDAERTLAPFHPRTLTTNNTSTMDFTYHITGIDGLFILAMSLLLGFEVIKNVPAVLHTPLMSGSNAISGIILFGGLIQLMSTPPDRVWVLLFASIAVLLGAMNIAGGFFVTHRMLSMFQVNKRKAVK